MTNLIKLPISLLLEILDWIAVFAMAAYLLFIVGIMYILSILLNPGIVCGFIVAYIVMKI